MLPKKLLDVLPNIGLARFARFVAPQSNSLSPYHGGALLQMKLPSTPLFGSDIADGLGEIPAMPVKVLGIVLALAVRMLFGFGQNDGPIPPRLLAVADGVFDPNLSDVRPLGRHVAFRDGEAALARFHLDAVIGNTETNGEPKSFRQPIGCHAWIRVNEHRNNGTRRHRPVESHAETLSLPLSRTG